MQHINHNRGMQESWSGILNRDLTSKLTVHKMVI